MEVNPMAIILVYLDSKGDRLLYRYPYQLPNGEKSSLAHPAPPPIVPHVDSSSSIVSSNSKTGVDLVQKKRSRFALQNADDLLQPAA